MPELLTLRVDGLQEFMIACDNAGKETKKYVRGELRGVGDIVRHDAIRRLSPYSVRSALGYRTRVSRHSVVVVQSLKKSLVPSSRRRNWPRIQMGKVLRPALLANAQKVEAAMVQAMDRVIAHFASRP